MKEVDFNQHLDEFNKITTELVSLEVKIEEENKVSLLLASPLSYFDNIITTILFGKETFKLDEVVAPCWRMRLGWGNNEFSNNGQVGVVTRGLVGDEGDQERSSKGPNIQGRVVRSSNATTAMRKVI